MGPLLYFKEKETMCECCRNIAKWDVLKAAMRELNLPLNYCPVCSSPRQVSILLNELAEIDIEVLLPETIRDENGKEMILDRSPQHGTVKSYTPPSLAIDLDKIDIEREMKLLEAKDKSDGN